MLKGRFLSAPYAGIALALASFVAMSYGCGRDHNLGVSTSSSSSSGAGGDGGAGSATSSSTSTSSTSSSGSGGEGGADAGPPGPTTLTIVNAVNDYGAVRLCFLPYPGGDPAAVPYPALDKGLAFGQSLKVDPISGPIPSGTDVRTWVLAGDLSLIANKTCDEAIAMAGAGVVATPLAVLPAIAFDSHKALLLAPAGCLGGPGHDGATATLGCGQSYTAANPTATLVVLPMSRTRDPMRVNLQVADLSAAMPSSDVGITPGFDGAMDVKVGGPLTLGAIAPNPPFAGLAAVEYGTLASAYVKTFLPNSVFTTSATPITQVLANSGLTDADFLNGKNFVLVAIGGYPGVVAGPFWHAFTFTLLTVDP